jgi:hypothetical protein
MLTQQDREGCVIIMLFIAMFGFLVSMGIWVYNALH